jgi:hypothetical protein
MRRIGRVVAADVQEVAGVKCPQRIQRPVEVIFAELVAT